MTDSHPFFRFVWRVNALILLGAAALGFVTFVAVVVVPLGRSAYRSGERQRGLQTPVPAAPRDPAVPQGEVLHVGTFARADGQVFHAPVYSGRPADRSMALSSVKGGGGRVRNVMIFNAETGAVARLFPDDTGRILDEDAVIRRKEDWPRNRTLARVYVYAAADTNGDGRLDSGDLQRVVVTRADGSQPTVLAEGVERYVSASAAEGGETILAYFVRRGGELQFGEFDLERFAPGRSVAVKVPPA